MSYNYIQKMMVCLLLGFLLGCGPQTEPPRETHQGKNTTTTEKSSFHLTPLTRLDAEHGLSSPVSITKHPKGMLIADYAEQRIFCFNDQGENVFQFGRKGDGPGEFQRPLRVSSSDEEIFVYDLGRRSVLTFALNGTFRKQEKLTRAATQVIFKNDRFYYGFFHKEGLTDIQIKHQDGTVIKEIQLKGADKDTYYATMAVDEENFLYTAALNKYSVEVYDPDGNLVRSFQRPYEPLPFIPIPKFKLKAGIIPVSAITFSKNYILVLFGGHQNVYENFSGKAIEDEYLMRIDVFDRSGKLLDYFWPDNISKKMSQLHHTPVFHLDEKNRLWIQDTQDFSTIHVMQLNQF